MTEEPCTHRAKRYLYYCRDCDTCLVMNTSQGTVPHAMVRTENGLMPERAELAQDPESLHVAQRVGHLEFCYEQPRIVIEQQLTGLIEHSQQAGRLPLGAIRESTWLWAGLPAR